MAMKNPGLRRQENLLARDESFFCSAFVAHLFQKVGFQIVPGITVKNTAPDDLARSPLPHTTYLLDRDKSRDKTREKAAPRVAAVRKAIATKVDQLRRTASATLKAARR